MPTLPSLLFVVAFTLLIVATAVRVLRFPESQGRQVLFRLMLVLSVVVGFCAGYGVAGAPMAAGSTAVLVVITRRSQRKHWDASDFLGGGNEVSPGWEPPPAISDRCVLVDHDRTVVSRSVGMDRCGPLNWQPRGHRDRPNATVIHIVVRLVALAPLDCTCGTGAWTCQGRNPRDPRQMRTFPGSVSSASRQVLTTGQLRRPARKPRGLRHLTRHAASTSGRRT